MNRLPRAVVLPAFIGFGFIYAVLALSQSPVSAASVVSRNPIAYCKMVKTMDDPLKDRRYSGPSTTLAILSAVGAEESQASQVSWRCMDGRVYACVDLNAPVCGKALSNHERPNKYETQFCIDHPNVPIVDATHGEWGCRGSKPVPADTGPVDKRGYSPLVWKVVSP